MFASVRVVLLSLVVGLLLFGVLIASMIINATSGDSTPVLTSVAAITAATRSLPAYWVVRGGDTFTTIAAQNRLTIDQLQELNPGQDPNALLPGQHLLLHLQSATPRAPAHLPPRFWIVRQGETYSSIAARTGVGIADIAQFNPRVDPNLLRPGQRLRLRR